MLSHEENQLLTRTDRGTPAGELFRRHWIPALQADEVVEPDGTPVRVRLLGERLVAFRDSNGKVGLVDEFCAHRGASLALARNEECGLRCLYHGWKYDVEGRCLDQPAEPAGSNFKDKIRQTAYPVREAGGVIWTYMGSASDIPPFPDFQWTRVPESQRVASKILEECNYLQGLEGGVDGIHSAYLHRALTETYTPWGIAESSCLRSIGLEHLEIEYTGYGYRIGAMTPEGEQQSVRVSQVILPCYTYVAEARGGDILFHAWVPRDDSSCWTWDIWFNEQKPIDAHEHMNRRGVWVDENFRKLRNLDNEWMQDREAMRNKSFSGIYGILTQDQAIQESMGPVYDRGREHLGTTDLGVLALRKVLLEAVQAVASGDEPTTRASRGRLDGLRSEQLTIPVDASWREACPLPSEFALT